MDRVPTLFLAIATTVLATALITCGDRVDPNVEPTPVIILLEPEIDVSIDKNALYAGHAEVLVDEELVSNSLKRKEYVQIHLPQGSYTLTVRMDGYWPAEKKVKILDTESQTFVFEPKLVR